MLNSNWNNPWKLTSIGLGLVATTYGKAIHIVPDETMAIDRSLNADRWR